MRCSGKTVEDSGVSSPVSSATKFQRFSVCLFFLNIFLNLKDGMCEESISVVFQFHMMTHVTLHVNFKHIYMGKHTHLLTLNYF